jgi:hypothetical protein
MSAAQANDGRELIQAFDSQFVRLHTRACGIVNSTPPDLLYRKVPASASSAASFGEYVLRSAAAVERTSGGITANLWDDPFEWTLPESLSTTELVLEYLEEVEATRRRAFDRFEQDSDLLKRVLVPAGDTQPLLVLLTDTLVRAADYQGRAIATLGLISNRRCSDVR